MTDQRLSLAEWLTSLDDFKEQFPDGVQIREYGWPSNGIAFETPDHWMLSVAYGPTAYGTNKFCVVASDDVLRATARTVEVAIFRPDGTPYRPEGWTQDVDGWVPLSTVGVLLSYLLEGGPK